MSIHLRHNDGTKIRGILERATLSFSGLTCKLEYLGPIKRRVN